MLGKPYDMEANYCTKCGSKISENAKFCGNCGEKLKEQEITGNICPKCGYVSEADEKFCPECGTALTLGKEVGKAPKSQPKPVRKKKSRPAAKKTIIPPLKKKKRGFFRTLGKVALWSFALLLVATTVLYFIGDDPESFTAADHQTDKPNESPPEEELTLSPIKIRQAHPKLSNTQIFELLPISKPQELSFSDKIKVHIPRNFSNRKQSLGIRNATVDQLIMMEGSKPMMLVDLTLDDGIQPEKPVEISYTYKVEDLNPNFTAKEQLEAFRWDSEGGGWVSLPIYIDEKNQTVSAIVDHFSLSGIFLKAYILKKIADKLDETVVHDVYLTPDENFKILYSKKAILADLDLNTSTWKKAPTGRTSKNPSNAPPYIQAIGYLLEEALTAYTTVHQFKKPTGKQKGYLGTYQKSITVKIDSWFTYSPMANGNASYEKLYERLHIPTTQSFIYSNAKITLAHELFHRIQAQYYGVLGMTSPSNQWWLEATAEFAAYELAWKTPIKGIESGCGNNYLTFPIDSRGDKSSIGYGWTSREFEYVTSIFIKYITKNGLDLKKAIIHDAADYSTPINSLESFMMENYKVNLSDIYQAFTYWMTFSPNGVLKKYPIATFEENSPKDIAAKKNKMALGEGKEVSYFFNMIQKYTSKVWAIQLIKSKTLKADEKYKLFVNLKSKSPGVNVNIFVIQKGKRSISSYRPLKMLSAEGQGVEIDVKVGQTLCIMTNIGAIDGGAAEVVVSDGVLLSIDPPEIKKAIDDAPYDFNVQAYNIPKDVEKINFEWDYNDGSKKGSKTFIPVTNGKASIKLTHAFKAGEKDEIYPLKVKLKSFYKDKTLATTEAKITVPLEGPKVFITERHLTGPPGATFDMEALASPNDIYKFIWEISGVGKSYTFEGKKSSIAPIIDKIGEYRATVKLYDLDGTYLSKDAVSISVEADNNNISRIYIGFDYDKYPNVIEGIFRNENYSGEQMRYTETIAKSGSKIVAKATRYNFDQSKSKPVLISDISIDGIDNANNLISISFKTVRDYSFEIREQIIRLVDVPFTKKVSDIPKSFVGGNKLFVEYRFEGDLKKYIREVKDRTERLDDGEVYNVNHGTKCSIYLSLTLK